MNKKIDKQEFIDLITNYINLTDNIDKLDQLLHACIYESKDYKFIDNMFHEILKYNFNDEDIELIDWWLYERRDNPELKMYIDKKKVPTETIEDIWNLL